MIDGIDTVTKPPDKGAEMGFDTMPPSSSSHAAGKFSSPRTYRKIDDHRE